MRPLIHVHTARWWIAICACNVALAVHGRCQWACSCINKSQKSFLNENRRMQGWNPQKPAKLDGNDTTILSYHPFILCTTICHDMLFCISALKLLYLNSYSHTQMEGCMQVGYLVRFWNHSVEFWSSHGGIPHKPHLLQIFDMAPWGYILTLLFVLKAARGTCVMTTTTQCYSNAAKEDVCKQSIS